MKAFLSENKFCFMFGTKQKNLYNILLMYNIYQPSFPFAYNINFIFTKSSPFSISNFNCSLFRLMIRCSGANQPNNFDRTMQIPRNPLSSVSFIRIWKSLSFFFGSFYFEITSVKLYNFQFSFFLI
jgi:hypothetical protein